MGKFNATKKTEPVTNYMGHKAYKNSPKLELANAVIATFIENSYYEKAEKRLSRITDLIEKIGNKDPEFIAKLAIYARRDAHIRSSFHVLVGELARVHRGDDLVSRLIVAGAERPDDLTEILAYVGKPVPNQVKKGIAKALKKFDKHQLAKYRGDNKEFSLTDAVRMFHPTPPQGGEGVYKKLAEGSLRSTNTWEGRLSAGEDKGATFKDMLDNKKLGYMATLRNLRNIIQAGNTETIEMAAQYIANENAVRGSKQLPFRFLSAYDAIYPHAMKSTATTGKIVFEKDGEGASLLIEALEKALNYSIQNIPSLPGRTLILSDNSGSMGGDRYKSSALSAYSSRTTADIANLFAVLYWSRAENTSVGLFGDRLIQPKLEREKGIFDNFNIVHKAAQRCGLGTEQGIFDAFRELIDSKQKVDRIVVFSDMQIGKAAVSTTRGWYGTTMHSHTRPGSFNALYQEYMKMFPDTYVYSVDLKGYGTTVFGGNVLELSGWSDNIFTVMQLMETDRSAFIEKIESIEL